MTTVENFGEMDKAIIVRSLRGVIKKLAMIVKEVDLMVDIVEDIVIESEEDPDGEKIV